MIPELEAMMSALEAVHSCLLVTGTSRVAHAKAAVVASIKFRIIDDEYSSHFEITSPISRAMKHIARSLRDLVVDLVVEIVEVSPGVPGDREDFDNKAVELYGGKDTGLYDNDTRARVLLQWHRNNGTRGATHGMRVNLRRR